MLSDASARGPRTPSAICARLPESARRTPRPAVVSLSEGRNTNHKRSRATLARTLRSRRALNRRRAGGARQVQKPLRRELFESHAAGARFLHVRSPTCAPAASARRKQEGARAYLTLWR